MALDISNERNAQILYGLKASIIDSMNMIQKKKR